jgi:hypothetical protein
MALFVSLLKNSNLSYIKKKLITLYILNVTDIIFTLILINTGLFMEGNVIMAPLINNNQLSTLFLKLFLPLILILWLAYRIKKATERQLFIGNIIINTCLIFYGVVNIFHVLWCVLYLIA